MRPQSRTGVSVPRPPSDNTNWILDKMGTGEQGTKKRAQKKEVFYFTSS